jgi:hypothetical protein
MSSWGNFQPRPFTLCSPDTNERKHFKSLVLLHGKSPWPWEVACHLFQHSLQMSAWGSGSAKVRNGRWMRDHLVLSRLDALILTKVPTFVGCSSCAKELSMSELSESSQQGWRWELLLSFFLTRKWRTRGLVQSHQSQEQSRDFSPIWPRGHCLNHWTVLPSRYHFLHWLRTQRLFLVSNLLSFCFFTLLEKYEGRESQV